MSTSIGAMTYHQGLGRQGEQIAVRMLTESGYLVLDRNWRCARGEIDIIARDGDTLVFCEVKTRSSLAFGAPAEAVHAVKAKRLRLLGLHWLAASATGQTHDRTDPSEQLATSWKAIRFDVVSVLFGSSPQPQVSHLKGVL